MANDIQIPTALTGIVAKFEGVDFCMDGAAYLIHTTTGATRLKGRSADAENALSQAADKKTKVTVMGYPEWGPECMYVSVYDVSSAKNPIEYIVIAFTAFADDKKQIGCSIVDKDTIFPMIYSKVFGPASKGDCEAYVAKNCG
jgi:hypothetical protein